jgi:hypothetical protein
VDLESLEPLDDNQAIYLTGATLLQNYTILMMILALSESSLATIPKMSKVKEASSKKSHM